MALKAQEMYGQGGAGVLVACQVLIGPRAPCWEEGMAVRPCRGCPVYATAREEPVADQGIPQLSS